MAIERKAHGRPSKRPSQEQLTELYKTMTAKEIGRKYGVPEVTVRSWIAHYRRLEAVPNDR